MLQINDLHSGYGQTSVIHGVTLRVNKEEIVALLGRNGAGKTTLLKTVMGHLKSKQGQIIIDKNVVTNWPSYKRARLGMSYVPQGRQIFPRLSVFDNLRVAALANHINPKLQIEWVLEEFPALKPKLHSRGGSLSGGQQQILAFARALISKPQILLLDEPNEGVQPSIVDEIFESIRRVNEKYKISILLVEQDIEFASFLANRVYLMNKGEIVASLAGDELLANKELQFEHFGV